MSNLQHCPISHSLSNLEFKRHVFVAVDLSDQSLKALLWTLHEFYRPGDCLHMIHVSRCMQPAMTIQHNYPGATYTIPNLDPLDEKKHAAEVKEVIKSRFSVYCDQKGVPHILHLYLDTDNAPASAVADTIFKVAGEYQAACIVMACHNKAYGWNQFLLGSVADYCLKNSQYPVMIVRDYKYEPPLVIPMRSANPTPRQTTDH